MKTTAQITVFCPHPSDDILNWATEGRLKLESRTLRSCDTIGGRLFSGATEQAEEDDWTSPISPGLESAQSIEVEAIDVPSALRARSYLYATSFADNSHRFTKICKWPRLYIGPNHSPLEFFGRLRAKSHIIVDQYAMARRSDFDEVAISTKLTKRQPKEQWLFRANIWQDHDYQALFWAH